MSLAVLNIINVIVLIIIFILISDLRALPLVRDDSPMAKLRSYCHCRDDYVICERLPNPSLLLSYDGPSVISLIITNSSLKGFKAEHLSKFSNVTSLTLESDNLCVGMSELSLMRSVVNMNLEDNFLTKIEARMFVANAEVENLYLGRNKITHLDREAFYGLSKLSKLKLEKNLLTRLESKSFDGLTELKELDLSFNELETLDSTVLEPVNNLELLSLRSNKVWSLAGDAVALLAARRSLRVDVANTRVACACGAAYEGWRAAQHAGLLHARSGLQDLLCSNGESWVSMMDRLICPSASATATTPAAATSAFSLDTSRLRVVSDGTAGATSSATDDSKRRTSPAKVTSGADGTVVAYEQAPHTYSESGAYITGAPSESESHFIRSAPSNSGEETLNHDPLKHDTGDARSETTDRQKFLDAREEESSTDFHADIYDDTHDRKTRELLHGKRPNEESSGENNSYKTSDSNGLNSNRMVEIVMVLVVSQVAIIGTIISANYYIKFTKIRDYQKRSLMSLLPESENESLEQRDLSRSHHRMNNIMR